MDMISLHLRSVTRRYDKIDKVIFEPLVIWPKTSLPLSSVLQEVKARMLFMEAHGEIPFICVATKAVVQNLTERLKIMQMLDIYLQQHLGYVDISSTGTRYSLTTALAKDPAFAKVDITERRFALIDHWITTARIEEEGDENEICQ